MAHRANEPQVGKFGNDQNRRYADTGPCNANIGTNSTLGIIPLHFVGKFWQG